MFLSDAILGYTPVVIKTVWSGLVGVDNCHRDDELVVTFREDAALKCTSLYLLRLYSLWRCVDGFYCR